MFVRPDQYQSVVATVVAEESRLDVAVAFWGEGADVHIHPEISKPIRMIVNLRSGGGGLGASQLPTSGRWAIQ